MMRRVSKGLSKGLNEASEAARSMAERSYSLGRSTSRGRPGTNSEQISNYARRNMKSKSKRRSKSKPLTKHLHPKPTHKRSE
jgi:hypothetical protein